MKKPLLALLACVLISGCQGNPFKGITKFFEIKSKNSAALQANNAKIAKNWLPLYAAAVNKSTLSDAEKADRIAKAKALTEAAAKQAKFGVEADAATEKLATKLDPRDIIELLKKYKE